MHLAPNYSITAGLPNTYNTVFHISLEVYTFPSVFSPDLLLPRQSFSMKFFFLPFLPFLPPARYTYSCSVTLLSIHSVKKQPAALLKEDGLRLPEGISVLTRNFRSLKLHVHPRNSYDAEGVKDLLEKKILVEPVSFNSFIFFSLFFSLSFLSYTGKLGYIIVNEKHFLVAGYFVQPLIFQQLKIL